MKGTITTRGKNRHLVRIYLGRDANGKQNRFTRTVTGTKKEAHQQMREWIGQLESGRLATGSKTTLDDYMAEWFQVSCKNTVAASSLELYQTNYERYISPAIGSLELGKIAPFTLQSLYHDLQEKGLSASTIRNVNAPLSRALKQAVKWRKLAHNPCLDVDLPTDRGKKRKVNPMTSDQATVFLEASIKTPWATMFEVALASGMRPSEYLGLSWPSVDWNLGGIRVTQAISRPKGKPETVGPPKTSGSRRTIPLPDEVMEGLKDHRKAQAAERLKAGSNWNRKLNLVFPGEHGEIWKYSRFVAQAFNKVANLAGLPTGRGGFSPYSLRHTCATLLLLENENPKVVSERLGHSTISETLDTYSHVLPSMQKGASNKLSDILFKSV